MNYTLEIKRIEEFVKSEGIEYALDMLELLFFKYRILEKSKMSCYTNLTVQELIKIEKEKDIVLFKVEILFKSLRELNT